MLTVAMKHNTLNDNCNEHFPRYLISKLVECTERSYYILEKSFHINSYELGVVGMVLPSGFKFLIIMLSIVQYYVLILIISN